MNQIPVIDFENFLTGDSDRKLAVAKELTTAVKTYGFAYLKNYGISKETINKMFDTSKNFFDCDLAVKKSVLKDHVTFCGYDEIEKEKLSEDRPPDLKESYMIKQNGTPWPNDLVKFKKDMLDFHAECYLLAFKLVRGLALGN